MNRGELLSLGKTSWYKFHYKRACDCYHHFNADAESALNISHQISDRISGITLPKGLLAHHASQVLEEFLREARTAFNAYDGFSGFQVTAERVPQRALPPSATPSSSTRETRSRSRSRSSRSRQSRPRAMRTPSHF
mmetsp:Transcript_64151/g.106257  ORF Transcript_64151/g.106257 Transcript_64151/m.106257 type:complete len:136 (-) Transcript_64151:57-464(-)